MGEEDLAGVRRALWWCVGCAVVFTVFAAATTHVRALRAHSPWQDDPYDVVVSFTQLLVPALAAAVVVRIAGRRPQPGPRDVRGGRAIVGMVVVTALVDWVAVALGVHADAGNGTGRLLIAALAVVTVAAAAAATAVRGATARSGARIASQVAGPDWADDVLTSVGDLLGRCGAIGRGPARAAGWLRRVAVGGRHGLRRHRLATVVLAGVAVSGCLVLGEAWGDGLGPHPAAAVTARLVIGTAGLLTALLPLNSYLGVLRPAPLVRDDHPVASASARRPALVFAVYAMVASVPLTVGFRDEIGALVDYPVTGWGQLARMLTVVAVLSGLIALLAQATRRRRRRLARALLAVPLVVVLAAVGTVSYLGVRHLLPRQLPAPTGPYGVGRTAYDWTDTGRVDPLAPEPGRNRELSVWIWYPAPAGTSGPPAPYAPGDWSGIVQLGILATSLDAVRTHSVADAPVASGRFPLVVLEPGMGLSAPHFSTLAEDLASHGYVVAAVTPTYSANVTVLDGHPVTSTAVGNPQDFSRAAGDRLVPVWAADARFAADRASSAGGVLAGHVDASRVAYVGHSFGGAASLQACHDDQRCAGAVDLDGTPYGSVVTAGLAAPMMLLGTPGDCVAGACNPTDDVYRDIDTASRSLRARSTGPSFRYEIAGAEHFNFTDYGAYSIPAPLHGLVQLGPIDGDRALVVVSASVTAFLDHVLGAMPAPDPDRRYPEAHPAA